MTDTSTVVILTTCLRRIIMAVRILDLLVLGELQQAALGMVPTHRFRHPLEVPILRLPPFPGLCRRFLRTVAFLLASLWVRL
jgi:hypothetical protein